MTETTSIDQLMEYFNIDIVEDIDTVIDIPIEFTMDTIFDFTQPQEIRLQALEQYYQEQPAEIHEIISKLMQIYCFTPVSLLQRFLTDIALHSSIELLLRTECAKTLCFHTQSEEQGYHSLDVLCGLMSDYDADFPAPYRFESICFLSKCEEYKCTQYILDFINEKQMSCEYRYRCILSLTDNEYYSFIFLENEENEMKYRILSGQNILSKERDEYREKTESILLSFATDPDNRYRSDAADVLILLGSDGSVVQANGVIDELGLSTNIYTNQQNVHLKSIEKGVVKVVEYLDTLSLKPLPHFDFICKRLEEQLDDEKQLEKVHTALIRIELDQTMFKEINYNLRTIFLMVYSYIGRHKFRDEMMKRMIEELEDMADTCTTGYLSRLINVLSGFGECSLGIGWEEQIAANLTGRLNAIIRKITDEELRDELLEDMSKEGILFDKPAFMDFFLSHISDIKEELYQEFRDHIPDDSWDLYFRKALIHYEGYR
jgi:hypothetical protein